jgi:branched-subunit amino acid transport protein
MSAWVAVGVLGAVSYALRSVVTVALGDRDLPVPVERFIGHLAPAVLAAMAAGSLAKALLASDGPVLSPTDVAHVAAVVVGGAVALRGGSVSRTLVAGVVAYVVVIRLLGG